MRLIQSQQAGGWKFRTPVPTCRLQPPACPDPASSLGLPFGARHGQVACLPFPATTPKGLALRLFSSSFVRFGLVGVSNTGLGYAFFQLALHVLPAKALPATSGWIAGYTVGTCWSFFWNRRWTFRSTAAPVAGQAVRFVTLQAVLGLLSAAAIGVSVDHFRLPATLTWLCVTVVITVVNFLLSRHWAFRQKRA